MRQETNAGKYALNKLIDRSLPRGRHVVVQAAAHSWMTMDRPDAVVQAIHERST